MIKIKSAAILKDGKIHTGKNHAEIFNSAVPFGALKGGKQGFVTSEGKFVDRKEAGQIAFDAKQIPKLTDCLFSEDLTGDWPWAKK